jgi:hypothetical protein
MCGKSRSVDVCKVSPLNEAAVLLPEDKAPSATNEIYNLAVGFIGGDVCGRGKDN